MNVTSLWSDCICKVYCPCTYEGVATGEKYMFLLENPRSTFEAKLPWEIYYFFSQRVNAIFFIIDDAHITLAMAYNF